MDKGYIDIANMAKFDSHREERKGVPEIVLAEGKTDRDLIQIIKNILGEKKQVIISRLDEKRVNSLKNRFRTLRYNPRGKIAVVGKGDGRAERKGKIGIITAGTSDVPVAEEARVIAEECGLEVYTSYDVGVAGIHRLFPALETLKKKKVDAMIVVAGMEGALPSVVTGLMDCIVIGVPSSTGYGYGAKGEAALMAMLQSCAPGLVVVNIDNGVGAALAAVMICKRKL